MINSQFATTCVVAGTILFAVSLTADFSLAITLLLSGVGGAVAGLGAGMLMDRWRNG
jgi:hypothetical protein